MELLLHNIGKIEDATIVIDGITVIAGENNTGKSTIGKVLYSLFNGFYGIEDQIEKERNSIIARILDDSYFKFANKFVTVRRDWGDVPDLLLQKKDDYAANSELLARDIKFHFLQIDNNFEKYLTEEFLNGIAKSIFQILFISEDEIFTTVLQKRLEVEFHGQITNIYSSKKNGDILLNAGSDNVEISIVDDIVHNIKGKVSVNSKIVYIDDPFILDGITAPIQMGGYYNHRVELRNMLLASREKTNVEEAFNSIIITKKMDGILQKINSVYEGELVRTRPRLFGLRVNTSDTILDVRNTSAGIKTFMVIKTLLLNGNIEDGGTIILDEPEVHLHPEWQLIFAEIIVLIQKEFNLQILLNSHSPYFLNAIQIYAAKHEIADRCKYYLAENNLSAARIVDVSDNIEKIYSKLYRPLQELENERCNDD